MSVSPQVAVLGAGYVGQAVARALATAGAHVWAVRRSAQPPEPGITWVAADLTQPLAAVLPSQLDAVILTVAPSGMTDDYAGTYPPAASSAIALAQASGATSLAYTSSTGVYGGADGAIVTEQSPRHGGSGGAPALIEAEDRLLGSGVAGVTVLRVAGIYGPERDPRGRFADPARLPQGGEYWVNLAHQADIVQGFVRAMDYRGAPRALNLADGSPTLACDVARWLAEARGIDPASLRFVQGGTRSRANQRVDVTALKTTGWAPQYPSFREGFSHGL